MTALSGEDKLKRTACAQARKGGILEHQTLSLGQWIILSIVLALYAFSLYITRKEKRSARSWYAERLLVWRIKQGIFVMPDDPEVFLRQQAVENEKPYELPAALRLIGKMQRLQLAGLDCVVLGGGSNPLRIIYLHGGAYVQQPLLPHWTFLDMLGRKTAAEIIVPLYPKAPVHTVEETLAKLEDLYRLLLDVCRACDTVVMGDSAGGGLTLAFAQLLAKRKLPQPNRLIMISPWLDVSMDNPDIRDLESKDPMLQRKHLAAMGRAWAGGIDVHDWRVSPLYGNCSSLAPMTVYVGTHELFLADVRRFKLIARGQGADVDIRVYPKMNHVFPLFPIPEAKRAMKEIVRLVAESNTQPSGQIEDQHR